MRILIVIIGILENRIDTIEKDQNHITAITGGSKVQLSRICFSKSFIFFNSLINVQEY